MRWRLRQVEENSARGGGSYAGGGACGKLRGETRGFGQRRPIEPLVDFSEKIARAALESDAVRANATQEHAAIGRIEREKIGAAQEIGALRVFFLKRFRILTEETGSLLLAGEAEMRGEQEALGLLVFVENVAVADPGGGQGLGALFAKELFQDFLPAEFAEDVVVEMFPLRAKKLVEGGGVHFFGLAAGEVQGGMHDLLGGERRVGKDGGKSAPAAGLHDGGGEGHSAEVRKNQAVLDELRRFLQGGRIAQIADESGRIELRQILQ